MSLTYDQRSEIRLAFDEAYVPTDRRRDLRIRQRVEARLAPWKRDREGKPFSVRIEDFSPGGVGIIHEEALSVGEEFLLRVPRRRLDELGVLLTVVRCTPLGDGTFQIGMELTRLLDHADSGQFVDALRQNRRLTSRRTKLLLLILGIYGLGTSLLLN